MVLALAVLFAPSLTRAGEAFAAVPDHQMQMMDSGHCNSAPSHSGGNDEPPGGDEAGAKSCCMSMCMGVATVASAPPEKLVLHGPAPTLALATQYRGRIAEIATPPPKFA